MANDTDMGLASYVYSADLACALRIGEALEAGMSPLDLGFATQAADAAVHVIGGADLATELDAKRAIRQGTELAAAL